MATTNGSTAIRDKILASLARYRALRIGKFPCAFWRLSARPGLTAVATDLTWRTQDIIQAYTLRWLIEVFFEDWKLYEGWGREAKQLDEEGSSRGLILSLLFDHCLLLHPEKIARIESKLPAYTVGESLFLRKLVLGIPAQASSKNLTRPLMPPAAPIRPRHLVPTQQGVGT
nr:hypothetical protein [Bathymodiolus japonicus methanotrophic gill symbiont]